MVKNYSDQSSICIILDQANSLKHWCAGIGFCSSIAFGDYFARKFVPNGLASGGGICAVSGFYVAGRGLGGSWYPPLADDCGEFSSRRFHHRGAVSGIFGLDAPVRALPGHGRDGVADGRI